MKTPGLSKFLGTLFILLTVVASSFECAFAGGRQLTQEDGQTYLLARYKTVYQDITTQLQAAILEADLDTAIALLVVSRDVLGLAAGLKFPADRRNEYLRYTPDRVTDPDVITVKALAGASLRLADCGWKSSLTDDSTTSNPQVLGVLKIAEVAIAAITPDDGQFPDGVNRFALQIEMIKTFADRMLMQQILDDNPVASNLGRKLLIESATPVNSWLCARCYPKRYCRRVTWWCSKP